NSEIRNEVPVHNIDVDDTPPTLARGAYLLTETGKISRKNRRRQLDQRCLAETGLLNLKSLKEAALEILTRRRRHSGIRDAIPRWLQKGLSGYFFLSKPRKPFPRSRQKLTRVTLVEHVRLPPICLRRLRPGRCCGLGNQRFSRRLRHAARQRFCIHRRREPGRVVNGRHFGDSQPCAI